LSSQVQADVKAAGDAAAREALDRLSRLRTDSLRQVGRYDHISGLPNRLQFLEHFDALCATGGNPMLVFVTIADVRHYNEILRALGHAFAEDFVRASAAILLDLLPETQPVFHISLLSLAFAVDHDGGTEPPEIVRTIANAFSGAISVNEIPITTRVGIGMRPLDGGVDATEALRSALVAALDGRQANGGFAFYNPRTDAAHRRAFRLLTDLPLALMATDQLSLHFQPRIDLSTGHVTGAEALLRWDHPELGSIPPGEFIPLAERTALIGKITDWVLNAAMRETRSFLAIRRHLRISVNASPLNLAEHAFDEKLLHLCGDYGLEPESLELEFTEGALVSNAERTTSQLESLRAAGIEIAIDDFGSGYSNLAYLTGIPADVLKIDQSLIRPIGVPRNSDFLVRQIVGMAKGLGFRVCAEGIETAKSYKLLRSIGCQEGQGYLIARPMPPAAFCDWLATAA
jgi:EAL domain-containing protein (putative c-di-GMP-specific phosphodiesterase class I)